MKPFKETYFEFEGYVTQLAGGSEVTIIGITLSGVTGCLFKVHTVRVTFEDLAGVKALTIAFNNSAFGIQGNYIASIDNSSVAIVDGTLNDDTVLASGNIGVKLPFVIGNGDYLYIVCGDTLDAGKKITVRIQYSSELGEIATIAAVGTGITLTTTVHRQL